MAAISERGSAHATSTSGLATLSRVVIVGLTLTTAYIHASLGGLLFLANAAGYATLALALVLPGPFATGRWLVRLALLGFTAGTVAAWFMFGGRFALAYVDKALEVVLIALLCVELWVIDGGPRRILSKLKRVALAARRQLGVGLP